MQLPERKKLFKNRHYRREEIEAQLRRAQFEDQINTEDSSSEDSSSEDSSSEESSSEDDELSESESEDEVIHEESWSSELEEADESEKKDESEEADESGKEDESEEADESGKEDESEEADESGKEDESEEADESGKEDESEEGADEFENEDELEEDDELVDEEECNSEISKSNETFRDDTPIAKNNVLRNKNKSDVDNDSQSLYDFNFNLNDEQNQVIEWMVTRESKKPHGGIIATDMGTVNCKITILMHLLSKSNAPNLDNTQSEGESDSDDPIVLKGCTLILCPRSSIDDWIDCIGKNIQPGTLNVWVHYGKKREISLHDLTQKDIVITTITLVQTGFRNKENSPLYQIKWHRIILDDIKVYNYKLQTCNALCQLSGICHWVFSASTIFNNDDDEAMYSLIKFINYKPLNMLENWKKWMKTNQTVSIDEKLKHLFYDKKII